MALPVGPVVVAVRLLAIEPVMVAVADPVLIKEVPLLPYTMLVADVDPLEPTLVDVPCAVACSLAADDVAEAETDPEGVTDKPAAMDDEPGIPDEPELTVAEG